MTPAVQNAPQTATQLLFGPGASAPEALARQILSTDSGANLDRTLRHLPPPTREAAVREAATEAAGLLDVDLIGLLLAGWRAHHDLTGAARRTLAAPGSTELVDLLKHQITATQQPSVTILVDGHRVATVQFSLSIVFDIGALVAGIRAGLLVAVHSGHCDATATLAIEATEVLTGHAHFKLPGVIPLGSGIRLLPAGDYPADGALGQPAAPSPAYRGSAGRDDRGADRLDSWYWELSADVVIILLDHVHGRLLRGRRTPVDPDVTRDQVGLLVRMRSLVLGHQTARPRVRAVIEQEPVHVLIPRVLVLVPGNVLGFRLLVAQDGVRLLLGQQLVQGLALLLLGFRGTESHPGRPPLRGNDAPVQGIIPRCSVQRVRRVQHLVVLKVSGLMPDLVRHRSAPLRQATGLPARHALVPDRS